MVSIGGPQSNSHPPPGVSSTYVACTVVSAFMVTVQVVFDAERGSLQPIQPLKTNPELIAAAESVTVVPVEYRALQKAFAPLPQEICVSGLVETGTPLSPAFVTVNCLYVTEAFDDGVYTLPYRGYKFPTYPR